MTAFTTADIPSQIDTVEKLASWCGAILFNVNPSVTAIEGTGYSERVSQWGRFWVPADSKTREIIRLSLEVSSSYINADGKPWTFVQPISSTAIPANFKSN
ncbi:glucose-6-phosphate dehydrogenase [Nostoc sp. T09]|uniref:glucose-6-phosphate dehydrogenase n=1 Tax=Nostoc sp. T09 TaxID=1932621 RepID=UPI000A3CEF08|nr:glucose-6-phosphate dehydrogenase [Nostoc sp. T09]OUL36362.1 glucose-6-phosphate dehydrogenase [Nostoc sp. T09]